MNLRLVSVTAAAGRAGQTTRRWISTSETPNSADPLPLPSFGELKIRRRAMMLYVLPPQAAAGPPSPWSTILCDDGQSPSVRGRVGQQELATANGGRLTYKRNASNNRRVKAWLNAVQKNNRPPPPRKPRVDITVTAGPEVHLWLFETFFKWYYNFVVVKLVSDYLFQLIFVLIVNYYDHLIVYAMTSFLS